MADQWEEFQDAHGDQWGEFADAPAPRKAKKTSQALGFYKGSVKPLDNAAMALEAGAKRLGVPTDRINNMLGMPSAAQAADQHTNAFANASRRPGKVGEIAGNIVGTIPVMMATKNPLAAGAGQGALLTDQRNVEGVATDMALGGALGHFGGKAVDAVSDLIKPVIDPAVQRLRAAGVSLTPGMIKGGKAMVREDKLMSRPAVGDVIRVGRQSAQETFNTATVNRALQPLGIKVPPGIQPGNESIAFAKKTLRDAYDDVIPRMAVKIDGRAFIQKLAPAAANLEAPQRQTLQQLLNEHLKNGQLTGQPLKKAHGELRRLASKYSRDPAAANNELGKVLYEAADELMGVMAKQNPRYAPQLQKVNAAYRGYKIASGAAKGADDGIFSTAQLKQSVIRNDRSKDKDAVARGVAFMQDLANDARKVLPARVPNSGTADRQQAGSLVAHARGAIDTLAYQTDALLQHFRLAPRPPGAAGAAQAVKRLKAPVAAGAVATAHTSRD